MSYKCRECDTNVPPGTPMLKRVEYRMVKISLDSDRMRREIAREVPVCAECLSKTTTEALAEKFNTR